MPIWSWVVIAVVVVILWYGIAIFNRLVRNRNEIDNAWAQVEVQLRRRSDLIPNLVETVRGYAKHERPLFERIAEARAAGQSARTIGEQAQAENQITQALRQLIAVAENYPELKASGNFQALHDELIATEGRIAFARQFYNDQVLDYNNVVQQFPSNTVAAITNFSIREYFEMEGAAAGPIQVEFS